MLLRIAAMQRLRVQKTTFLAHRSQPMPGSLHRIQLPPNTGSPNLDQRYQQPQEKPTATGHVPGRYSCPTRLPDGGTRNTHVPLRYWLVTNNTFPYGRCRLLQRLEYRPPPFCSRSIAFRNDF